MHNDPLFNIVSLLFPDHWDGPFWPMWKKLLHIALWVGWISVLGGIAYYGYTHPADFEYVSYAHATTVIGIGSAFIMALFAFEFIVGVLFAYACPQWLLRLYGMLWSRVRARVWLE